MRSAFMPDKEETLKPCGFGSPLLVLQKMTGKPYGLCDGTEQPLDFFISCAERTLFFASTSRFTARMFVLMGNACHSEDISKQARGTAGCSYVDAFPVTVSDS